MSRISRDIEQFILPPKSGTTDHYSDSSVAVQRWPGWVPLLILPPVAFGFRNVIAPWVLMWLLALALYLGCKWLTWWRCVEIRTPAWRHWAYLLVWPGMDAKRFLDSCARVPRPGWRSWFGAWLNIMLGALLVWCIARWIPHPLIRGLVGLIGLVLMLHFGSFQVLALVWQRLGINAQPIMREPIRSQSLAEFWGKRWNSAFNLLVHNFIFRKTHRLVGTVGATLLVFFVSGIIHDLVISVPARGGYGLPTAYFLLQGAGLCFERSPAGRKLGLGHGLRGRCFTLALTAIPAFLLFHPPFIKTVILPMLHAIGAT